MSTFTYDELQLVFQYSHRDAWSSLLGSSVCPAGWHYYNNNCFYISTTKANQQTARSSCQAMNAELTSISSQAEMDFVKPIS